MNAKMEQAMTDWAIAPTSTSNTVGASTGRGLQGLPCWATVSAGKHDSWDIGQALSGSKAGSVPSRENVDTL